MSVSVYNTVLIHVFVFIPFFCAVDTGKLLHRAPIFFNLSEDKNSALDWLEVSKARNTKKWCFEWFFNFWLPVPLRKYSFLSFEKTLLSDTNSNSMISSMILRSKILIDQTMKCIMPMIMSGTTSAPSPWPIYSS